MQVLVVNAGSSSLKLRVLDPADGILAATDIPSVERAKVGDDLMAFLEEAPGVDAAGHRVVHGGPVYTEPVLVDDVVDRALEDLAALAPLHNPPGLAAVAALRSVRPDLTQVICFDTGFHVTMPAEAATYAVPRVWREEWGIKRYGFHGLSHAWASRRASELLGRGPQGLRLVTAHLGAGASLAAVSNGRSVDTTMGFTPLEGVVMATRSGSIDPAAVLWVQRHRGLSVDRVEEVLERESGLLGLSGTTGDLRMVIASADAGDMEAQLAYDVYVHRIRAAVAAMTAALDGMDGLVFTGGAGEASARLRADVCSGLGFLGVKLAQRDNQALRSDDAIVSLPGTTPSVLVVHAREDREIARHVRELLG